MENCLHCLNFCCDVIGDFVLVQPIEEGDKVKAEIIHILYKDQIRYIQQEGLWWVKQSLICSWLCKSSYYTPYPNKHMFNIIICHTHRNMVLLAWYQFNSSHLIVDLSEIRFILKTSQICQSSLVIFNISSLKIIDWNALNGEVI